MDDATGVFGHSMGRPRGADHRPQEPGPVPDGVRLRSDLRPVAVPVGREGVQRLPRRRSGCLGRARRRRPRPAPVRGAGRSSSTRARTTSSWRRSFIPTCSKRRAGRADQRLDLRRHPGYDHSYYFIQTFIADHLAHTRAAWPVDHYGRGDGFQVSFRPPRLARTHTGKEFVAVSQRTNHSPISARRFGSAISASISDRRLAVSGPNRDIA